MPVKTTSEDKLQDIPVKFITITKANPRKVNTKSPKFAALKQSIKTSGVAMPIIVRHNGDGYDLLAGERRLTACKELKLDTIPALVRTCTDAEAFEITFLENHARLDLLPLEEAIAASRLLESNDGDLDAVASKLDKSRSYVASLVAIDTSLSKEWKKIIKKHPDGIERWTVAHYSELVKMTLSQQNNILDNNYWDTSNDIEFETVSKLKRMAASNEQSLDCVGWQLDKKYHLEADILGNNDKGKPLSLTVCCATCPKRKSAQPDLFFDKDEDNVVKNDKCLDKKCYTYMTLFTAKAIMSACKTEGMIFIMPPSIQFDYTQREKLGIPYNYRCSKKSVKGAVRAMFVGGQRAGKTIWIEGQNNNSSNSTKPIVGGVKKPKTLKERNALLTKKRMSYVLDKFIEILAKKKFYDATAEHLDALLDALVIKYKASSSTYFNCSGIELKSVAELMKQDLVARTEIIWAMVKGNIISDIRWNGPITQVPDATLEEMKFFVNMFSIDLTEEMAASKKEYPTPKSWANLKADGTPK